MRFSDNLSDEAALAELGQRLAQHRLNRNLTQMEIADSAGVSRNTIARLEAGEPTQTANLIRVLRVLNLLGNLDALVPDPSISPLQLLRTQGARPRRASRRARPAGPSAPWAWDDDK